MNLMTAGRGIAHSERTPDVQRRDGQKMLGLQSWIALPAGSEEIAPSFQHYAAESLPTVRITASPRASLRQWFRREIAGQHGVAMVLHGSDGAGRHQRAARPDHEERAIYLVDGEVEIANERHEGPRLLIFRPGDRITVKTVRPTRMMFLGGDARKARDISGGVSCPPAKSGSSRPNRTGKPAVLPPFPGTRVHSAAGVSYCSVFYLRARAGAPLES